MCELLSISPGGPKKMFSHTEVAGSSLPPIVGRAVRRARFAPYISVGFAVLAIGVLVLFAHQAEFFSQLPLPPPKPRAAMPAERVTVSQSTITGFDKDERPFSVTAQSAVQDKDAPSRVYLKTVSGESQKSNGEILKMRANSGLYDSDAKDLSLSGEVVISSEGRFIARMDTARVDVREKRLVSYSPVIVDLSGGSTIEAKALQITNDGHDILFFNGVRAKFKSQVSQ
jgi:lipopolysaccharide export system protein LptC